MLLFFHAWGLQTLPLRLRFAQVGGQVLNQVEQMDNRLPCTFTVLDGGGVKVV
ncbi:MAG: hypothetical protein HY741_10405 [Chloroflexi bacterium]|nr:hypothetical protein [Chloroflexota bacterium]